MTAPSSTAATDELLVTTDGPVRWITINRPASRNGLTSELNARIIAALDEAAADSSVRVVAITGEGGAFCSGLDLKDAMRRGLPPDELESAMDRYFHGLIRAIRRAPQPVIALVDGPAVGFGCDLALACDLRVGTPDTRFGEIFVKRGLMPDGGGTFTLPRLVGVAKALELMLLGDMIDAEEAQRLGLLSALYPPLDARSRTHVLALRLAEGAPLVHRLVKQSLYASLDGTLDEALARERAGQLALLRSADFAEGLQAFFEKRPPRFQGK